jgi:type VI protein secretion system component VasF
MNKLPAWAKALAAIVIFAVLYGGAQLLIQLDKTASGKVGLD